MNTIWPFNKVTHDNAGAGPFQSKPAFKLLQSHQDNSFCAERQTLIPHILKKGFQTREISPAIYLQPVVDRSSCIQVHCPSSLCLFRIKSQVRT